ncbi:hypothetical protein [Haladaptatus cibarius]|uniref:hypothetical protein n=1 Tax=Haladaptatus cibarius TaxID=453847 RepID=UPI00067924D7|nr:hypothetical protein [Haladaptatus cibarius]
MSAKNIPSSVPVCSSIDEKNEEYQEAQNEQRPFLAVVDDDDLPGWQAIYVMDTTGEGRENWYYLTDEGVEMVEKHRSSSENHLEHDSWTANCSDIRGELHGLAKGDAEYLADKFAEVVWDEDYWKKVTLREVFQGNY